MVIATIVAIAVWFLISLWRKSISALDLGRKWLAGSTAFILWYLIPPFLRTGDDKYLRGGLVLLVVLGLLFFGIGFFIGKFRGLSNLSET